MRHSAVSAVLCLLLLAATPAWAMGPLELDAGKDFATVLTEAMENHSRVELGLKNGATFKGTVGSVDGERVVIDNLDGREFFSAVILLPEVVSIETRTRDQ